MNVIKRFEQVVAEHGSRIAVSSQEEVLSYSELNERANQLARYLQEKGVKPNSCVGFSLDRSSDMIVAILAILKVGAAYVPIDVTYPLERKRLMIEQAKLSLLIINTNDRNFFEIKEFICIDDAKKKLTSYAKENLNLNIKSSSLAYINFTSGSTGKPKGVRIPHRGILRLVQNTSWISIEVEDRFLQLQNISFDGATFEIWGALLNGARLALFPNRKIDPDDLADCLVREKISILFLTTRLFHLMVEEKIESFQKINYLIAGGEVMSLKHAQNAFQILPGKILNAYGPTENTTFTTVYTFSKEILTLEEVPIGQPIDKTTVYLLDENNQPVSLGNVGELWTGGEGVALGYLGEDLFNHQKFIENPFGEGLLYRTGDLACQKDGQLFYRGRMDNQVKIRGYRIELSEIEAVLRSHSDIVDCTVLTKRGIHENLQLIAYVQPQQGLPLNGERYREFLSTQLPDYMVPSCIVCLPALPLTPHGKVDSKALADLDQKHEEPHFLKTKWEKVVASLWEELFGWKGVHSNDHFFRRGGDSLGAMKLISRLRNQFQLDLSIDLLFKHPILADLAHELERIPRSFIKIASGVESTVLSFNEEALWIEDQMVPGSTHYAIPFAFRLNGRLDRSRLEKAFNKVMDRHEILRAQYDLKGRSVHANTGFFLWQKVESPEAGLSMLIEKASLPIHLGEGPIVSLSIFEVSDDESLLLFYAHHIVIDDFAVQQIFTEIAHYYTSPENDLDSPSIQYKDFAHWQRAFIETPNARDKINYWKHQLAGTNEILELPWDKTRLLTPSRKGAAYAIKVSPLLLEKLDCFAKDNKVSKFVVLLSAYFVLLHRYSNQTDICVGTPVANRDHPDIEKLVGFCSQVAVIRANLFMNPSFLDVVKQINQLMIKATENGGIPFEKIVSELNPSRHASHNPIFQVGFGYENWDDLVLRLENLDATPLDVPTQGAKFDLYLTIKHFQGDLSCHFEYSTNLFGEATIERMAQHYLNLMERALDGYSQSIGNLPILTRAEIDQLAQWNNTSHLYKKRSIYRRFEEMVNLHASSTAIRFNEETLSYHVLNEQANRLARFLLTQGAQKGSCIGIAYPRSPELMIGMLAILKVGAVFVPIDCSYPEARRDAILKDASITLILSDQKQLFPDQRVFCLQDAALINETSNLDIEVDSEELSHLFYTSGSTGKPKGVRLTHQGVISLIDQSDWFPIGPGDRVLQFSAIGFDLMILEIWGALLNGALVSIYPEKEVHLEKLSQLIFKEKITHAIFTPRIFNLLVENQIDSLKGLRYLISAGEAMSVHHARLAQEGLPNCKIVNGYGPTETNFATAYTIKDPIAPDATSIPIGKPISNIQAYLLNESMQPVPIGVIGELYIGGDSLALGYQNNSRLTEAKFIANPFGSHRLYRTGDLCRLMCNGNLQYVGRRDTQVKIRGFRVELGEIEEVLKNHPSVADCVACVKSDSLFAYIVYEKNKLRNEKALEAYASAKLPEFMVPNFFVEIETIPLTSNGKVDIKMLPQPKRETFQEETKTQTETMVAEIWSQILQIENIHGHDHFFKLGGSSIHAIQVVSLFKKKLNIDLPMNLIFQFPVLKDFASQLSLQERTTAKIPKRNPSQLIKMPWNQESFWQIDKMIPNSSNYTMVTCFQLEGQVHIPSMEKAINKIISRHEALRTRFEDRGDYRVQIVETGPLEVFKFTDFRNKEHPEIEAQLYFDQLFAKPFDLTKLPLIEVHLIQVSDEKFAGALYVHHIVFDGWSIGVFFKEWRKFYRAYLHGLSVSDPNPLIQHPDFACWQNTFFQSEAAKKQMSYWKQQIQGVKLIELPVDFPRVERFKGGGDIIQWTLPQSLSNEIKKEAKKLGVTLYEFILATYYVWLYHYSGQEDLLIGSPFANRTKEEVEPLLGFFIHMFAIRVKLSDEQLFDSFLKQVSEKMAKAYENSDIPCETIFADLYPNWNPTFNRFQIGFSLDTIADQDEDFEGIKTTWSSRTNAAGKFDFYLGVLVAAENIHLNMYYCSDLYRRERVNDMLTVFQQLLSKIVKNPHLRIHNLTSEL